METKLFNWLHGRSFANHRINILMYDVTLYLIGIITTKPNELKIRYDTSSRSCRLMMIWEIHNRTSFIAVYKNGMVIILYNGIERTMFTLDNNYNVILTEFDEYLIMSEIHGNSVI